MYRERITLSEARNIVTRPPAFWASMARASIRGMVCLPPEITTTSPGLTLTDVVITCWASRPKSLSWGFAGTAQKIPKVKTPRADIQRREDIFLIVETPFDWQESRALLGGTDKVLILRLS